MIRAIDQELEYPGPDGRYYLNGEPFAGILYTNYPGGELEYETEYRGGMPWGIHRKYRADGAIAEEGHYVAGYEEGVWRTWHENGNLACEETRELDATLRRKRWSPVGELAEDFALDESSPQFRMLVRNRLRLRNLAPDAGPQRG